MTRFNGAVKQSCRGGGVVFVVMEAEKRATISPTYSVFNRQPCIPLGNLMGTTLFYIILGMNKSIKLLRNI